MAAEQPPALPERPAARSPQWPLRIVGLVVSIVLVGLLFRSFDMGETWRHLQRADYRFALPIFALGFLNFALRAWRWGRLFPAPRPRGVELFNTNLAGYFANTLLPARAGELVRVYALSRRAAVPASTVLGTVLVERILELVIVVVLMAVVVPRFALPAEYESLGGVGAVAVAAVAFLVVVVRFGEALSGWLLARLGFLPAELLRRLEAAARGFLAGISTLRERDAGAGFLAASAGIWLLELSSVWLVGSALGLSLSPLDSLFVMLMVGLGAMIPSSPGGVGTFEWAAVIALSVIGIRGDIALSMALLLHFTALATLIVLGGVALAIVGSRVPEAAVLESEGL